MIARIDKVDGIYLKRNDLNEFCGCYGGKAECAYELIQSAEIKRFVTCGSRDSLQCEIVSQMCDTLGYECHIFMPKGSETKSMSRIKQCRNAVLHPIKDGHMVVVKKRAMEFAVENNMTLIPFGMQSFQAVRTIAKQTVNIPDEVKRIIVPVGGGITMCGVLQGLADMERYDITVIGVITGGDPHKTISRYKPMFCVVNYGYILCPEETGAKRYNRRVDSCIGDIKLDPIYEGKCKEFLKEGDLFWIVGYHEV